MRKKYIRIRYRKFGFIRTYKIIRKKTLVKKNVVIAAEKIQENTSVSHNTVSQVVSFDVNNNPYLTLIAQLPTLLSSMPNGTTYTAEHHDVAPANGHAYQPCIDLTPDNYLLNNEVAETLHTNDSTSTEVGLLSDSCLLSWSKEDFDLWPVPKKPSIRKALMPFWSATIENSCQKIRFGGDKSQQQKLAINDNLKLSRPDEFSVYQQLSDFVTQEGICFTWLALLLSDQDKVIDFIQNSKLSDVLLAGELATTARVNTVTVQDYFQQAINAKCLYASGNILAFLCKLLAPQEPIETNSALFSTHMMPYLNEAKDAPQSSFFSLSIGEADTGYYFELNQTQALVYSSLHHYKVYSLTEFSQRLRQNNLNIPSVDTIVITPFSLVEGVNDKLALHYQEAKKSWSTSLQQAFYQFINSP